MLADEDAQMTATLSELSQPKHDCWLAELSIKRRRLKLENTQLEHQHEHEKEKHQLLLLQYQMAMQCGHGGFAGSGGMGGMMGGMTQASFGGENFGSMLTGFGESSPGITGLGMDMS